MSFFLGFSKRTLFHFLAELFLFPLGCNFVLNVSFSPLIFSCFGVMLAIGIPQLYFYTVHRFAVFDRSPKVKFHNNQIILEKRPETEINQYFTSYLNCGLDIAAHIVVYYVLSSQLLFNGDVELNKKQHRMENVLFDFMIPFFMFEMCYDLFYYCWHYMCHRSKFLYTHVHYLHHEIKYTNYFTDVYHMSLYETVVIRVTNGILHNLFSFYFFPFLFGKQHVYKLTTRLMIQAYVEFVEFAGHAGLEINAKEVMFSRWCISWVSSNVFGSDITLNARQHDLHHQILKCNYSKRLAIWDKLFHTYVKV